jgi:IS5 family transposase
LALSFHAESAVQILLLSKATFRVDYLEQPFRYIKRVFGYEKVRYRGLEKNGERLHMLAAFTNLMVGKICLLT